MKIVVLLSGYNGEKFIREQIESILKQDITEQMELSLLVRDDGSKDGTHAILNEYQEKGALTWYTGENLRPAKSFWHLVRQAPDADYYAFCDQDDVWFSDKLSRAVRKIETEGSSDKPTLYCSAVTVTDAQLNPTGSLATSHHAKNEVAYSLLYSMAPGCTFVFNRAAREEFLRYDMDQRYPLIHDWLAHKIVALTGTLIHDPQPSMFYRQHGNNVIGSKQSGIRGIVDRIKRFMKDRSLVRSRVARELLEIYDAELPKDGQARRYLYMVANYREDRRLRSAFRREKAFRTGTLQDFFLICLIVIRKI